MKHATLDYCSSLTTVRQFYKGLCQSVNHQTVLCFQIDYFPEKSQAKHSFFSSFGESKFSLFSTTFENENPRLGRLEFDRNYVRDHGMCLDHLLAKYGCSSTYSFPIILIPLGWGNFRWDL